MNSAGKGNRPVATVFGFNPCACHQAVSYLCQQQPGIPVWVFSIARPSPETVALCERVEVRRSSIALLLHAQFALWPRRVVLCVGTWTGQPGKWLLKLAPFLVPPFRVLLLNANGDYMPGRLGNVLSYGRRWLRDRAHDLGSAQCDFWRDIWRSSLFTRARQIVAAISLLAIATIARWLRYRHRALFHRLHGGERLRVAQVVEDSDVTLVRYEQQGTSWPGESLRRLVDSTDARWILWRSQADMSASSDAPLDTMLQLFEDDGTFAVSFQSHVRGWKPILFPTAPFRKLQAGEATRLLAPLSGAILVSRKKLAALGVPDSGLATTAWLLLFWRAAAAGWRSYAVGTDASVSAEPDFPVQETAFILRVLSNNGWRLLGPCEPELSRGNIAFKRAPFVSFMPRSERLRVLVVSPFLPYPLSHGGAVRIFNLCRALCDRVDFGLVAIREASDVIEYSKLHDIFRNVWTVDLDEPESGNLQLPRQVRRCESGSLRALVADLCGTWKPDLLQVEYTHLACLRESATGVPAILVEHDLTLGLYRQLAQYEPSESNEQEYQRWLAFEQRWLRAYEGVWAMSDEEREEAILQGNRRTDRTFTIPNGVDTLHFRPREDSLSGLEVLYVGSFRHFPNILAFEKLCSEIMPQVWAKIPTARVRIVAGPDHKRFGQMLRSAARYPTDKRIEVLDFVEDLRPLYARAAVVVVPLMVSSGTNIKVLEAMACGKAIVSTPAGCTGLGLRDGHDIFIRQDWGEFARTVCELLCDEFLRLQLGSNARHTAEERFCWDAIAQRAFQSYLTVLDRGQQLAAAAGSGRRA